VDVCHRKSEYWHEPAYSAGTARGQPDSRGNFGGKGDLPTPRTDIFASQTDPPRAHPVCGLYHTPGSKWIAPWSGLQPAYQVMWVPW
jgi:hypothetical protein